MIFSSVEYAVFFILSLLFFAIVKSAPVKKGFLLVASYFFYAYWDYRFVLLMLAMTAGNYFLGEAIARSPDPQAKKRYMLMSVVFSLAVLAFFKYFNFFIDSFNALSGRFGLTMPFLSIILPVGISFITFEVLSYNIDIYRGANRKANSFWDLALLVAFFPHLIAGPILKPSHFLPQLQQEIVIRRENLLIGGQIFLFGLVKKILIADQLAPFVDAVFKEPGTYSTLTIWLAALAYAVQIYCDFSGYSDMAIGSARCMGFSIPQNFNMPYLSRSITEFWRRWHISLSTWLREYLYISLGGNRCGKLRQYFNLVVVMLLGGLWHGASWNFVIWGGIHGFGLIVHKLWMEGVLRNRQIDHPLYHALAWLLTFVFVCFAWIFFRAADFAVAASMIQRMLGLGDPAGITWTPTSMAFIVPILILAHAVGSRRPEYPSVRISTFRGAFALAFVLLGLLFLMPVQSSPFIYFQF